MSILMATSVTAGAFGRCACRFKRSCTTENHHTKWCYINDMADCPDSVQGSTKTVKRLHNLPWSEAACEAGDLVIENSARDIGGFGGSCTCPDGSVFQVGDNHNNCGSLACIGGESGKCIRRHGEWSGRKVTCAGTNPNKGFEINKVEENKDGVGGFGGSCTCPDGSVFQVGDNFDDCGSLACVGGVSGKCNKQNDRAWSKRKVTCGAAKPIPATTTKTPVFIKPIPATTTKTPVFTRPVLEELQTAINHGCSATVYEHKDYQGWKHTITKGLGCHWVNYGKESFAGDHISAIKVHGPCALIVAEHPNGGGATRTFTKGEHRWIGDDINDTTSSIRLDCNDPLPYII